MTYEHPSTAAGWTMAGSRPGIGRTLLYFMGGLLPRALVFIVVLDLLLLGASTAVVWVGLPILALTFTQARRLCDVERRWVARLLDTYIPPAPEVPGTIGGTMLQRVFHHLTSARTWCDIAYLLIAFPLSLAGAVASAVGVVVFPVAVWVVPWVGWAYARVAVALLGPRHTENLQRVAEHLQSTRARGVNAAEAERRRIERDLHDGAQQRMVAVAMSLGRAKAKMDGDPEKARRLLDEAHTDAVLAISEIRDLARGIYPAVLTDRGLDAALSALAAKAPFDVEIDVRLESRPPAAVETTAYFIVGEALTNAAKHAGASTASVLVRRLGAMVTVEVCDDGRGGAEIRPGGGLAGLSDRAAPLDGVVIVDSPIGGPTRIVAELPCIW